ncbi:MAG: dihydropteroate synthase [Candidatus Margulisiibacteriota bacterium]|jgi:dihydropteroate synthase
MQIFELDRPEELERELQRIGCDPGGVKIMRDKGGRLAIKAKAVNIKAALILKQEMLSLGGDSANHRETISGKITKTDVLLLGTIAHYKTLVAKLMLQPFGLKELALQLQAALDRYSGKVPPISLAHGQPLAFERALLMGILNCTPDSFADGGRFADPQQAIAHGKKMILDGADIIDIGGESSRPGAEPVLAADEAARILPAISALSGQAIVSVDTYKSAVAEQALAAGAQILNDITALRGDIRMAAVAALAKCPIVLMHMQGTPQTMQCAPVYEDIIYELLHFFEERISFAISTGIKEENIIIDPGLGFGKTVEHNLSILNNLKQFRVLGRPVLIGPSGKSFIGKVLDLPVADRREGTAASVCFSVFKGANILRVHDVMEMSQAVRMTEAIMRESGER